MKRKLLIIFAVLWAIYVSAQGQDYRSEINELRQEINALKDRVHQLEQQNAPNSISNMSVSIPCMEESYDTMEEARALGIGEGTTAIQAKQEAIKSAVEDLSVRIFHEFIKYITISHPNGETEARIENNITEEQKQYINKNSQLRCYEIIQKEDGTYQAYVAISLPSTKNK